MAQLLTQARSLAADLPGLVLAAERLAFIAAPGLHGRRRGGAGDAFWQFRDWRNGDDARRIDWRRSAQGQRLYFRERESAARAKLELMLQDTPTLAFRSAASLPSKRERAILLLLATAAILLRAGEHVVVPANTSRRSGGNALERIAASILNRETMPPEPAARHITFGDFLAPAARFTGRPGGAVLHILDPAECDFPFTGRVVFEGLQNESRLEAASAEAWREVYGKRIAAQKHAVAQAAFTAGQTPVFHRTDQPPGHALAALYQALRRA